MPANIHQPFNSVLIANHNDRNLTNVAGDEVSDILQLRGATHVLPVFAENLLLFRRHDGRVGVKICRQRNAFLDVIYKLAALFDY
jgi:hypothetical protein